MRSHPPERTEAADSWWETEKMQDFSLKMKIVTGVILLVVTGNVDAKNIIGESGIYLKI